MKIYLASKFERQAEMAEKARELEALGAIITSRWVYAEKDDNEVSDATKARYALLDMRDVYEADVVISTTEGELARGGRHVEFGMGVAWGKTMYVVGPREHIFHWLEQALLVDSWEEMVAIVRALTLKK